MDFELEGKILPLQLDNVYCPSFRAENPPVVSIFCLFPRKEKWWLKAAFNRFGFFLIIV